MLLRDKDRQTLLRIFSAVTIPIEVWAYGSCVNGTAHDGRDLDLVIRGKDLASISLNTMDTLCESIRDSNIPILVELRDWARLPASFQANITRQYEVLFDNRSSYN